MAYEIAGAAAARGHRVVIVSGPVALPAPAGVEVLDVLSAREMLVEAKRELQAREHRVLLGVAAVADFRPKERLQGKPPKERGAFALELVENPDVLSELSALGRSELAIGFALESFAREGAAAAEERARSKMARKGLDAIVLNEAAAMESTGTALRWIDANGASESLGSGDKAQLAKLLVTRIEARLGHRGEAESSCPGVSEV
jgi:phosphopantothenoylcysteine decarboxylase/phosphopantothenate--cysteine ligase